MRPISLGKASTLETGAAARPTPACWPGPHAITAISAKIAAAMQLENYSQVPSITLGQFQIPTAYRESLAGRLGYTGPLFWNVKRA